jgi:hypothetical protein
MKEMKTNPPSQMHSGPVGRLSRIPRHAAEGGRLVSASPILAFRTASMPPCPPWFKLFDPPATLVLITTEADGWIASNF